MRTETFEHTVCQHYMSALINGDWSGLDEDEAELLREFVEGAVESARDQGAASWTWTYDSDEEASFQTDDVSGLMGDCVGVCLLCWVHEDGDAVQPCGACAGTLGGQLRYKGPGRLECGACGHVEDY